MIEAVFVIGLVVVMTAVVYMLGVVGTKEKSFEDALAEQRQRQKEESGSKAKKQKVVVKKMRPSRPRQTENSSHQASADEAAGATTEDETVDPQHMDAMELMEHQQQEYQRLQAEKQRARQLEKERQLQLEKEQEENTQKAKREQQEKEQRTKKEQQEKELRAKKEQQEKELNAKKEQELLQEQQLLEQEAKKTDKKRKQHKPEPEQQLKQTKGKQEPEAMQQRVKIQKQKPYTNGSIESAIEATMSMETDQMPRTNGKMDRKSASEMKRNNRKGEREESPYNEDDDLNNGVAKKNKKNAQKPDKGGVVAILKVVENAQLSSDQIQKLVDSLLLMAADGGWSEARKGADTALGKKLEEANSKISRHQETELALTNKISDLRTDLNNERSKTIALRKQLEAAAVEQQKVAERESHQLQQAKQQLVQQLQEESKRMQLEYEEKLRQVEASSADSQRVSREETAQHFHQQNHAALQSIQELQQQLTQAQTQNQQMQFQVEQISTAKAEAESLSRSAQQEISRLTASVETQQRMILSLQQEKENLESLATESVRSAADGQETDTMQQEQTLADLQKETEKVALLSKEVDRLTSDLEATKSKNDELRQKNSSVLAVVTATEARLAKEQTICEELKSSQDSFKAVLRRLHPKVSVPDNTDNAAFLQQFEAAAKNEVGKVVEKIVQDPQLKSRLESLEKENTKLKEQTAKLESSLEAANRSLSIAEKEKDALQKKLQQQVASPDTEKQLKTVQEENRQLQEKITNYQTVLDNTESLLTTLQSSVESEATKWQDVVQEKEDRLVKLTQENQRLEQQLQSAKSGQQQTDKLQLDLEQIKKEKKDLEDQLSTIKKDKGDECEQLRELVMVGQESSKEQELLIGQLQSELHSIKSGCSSNGPPSTDAITDDSTKQ